MGELLDIPINSDSSELSEDEISLLELYRKTRPLPSKARAALRETLEVAITLYLSSHSESKRNGSTKRNSQK